MHLRPSPAVRSAIEIDVLDGYDPEIDEPGDDPYQPIREAWDGERLRVTDATGLWWALCRLSNAHDETVERMAREAGPGEVAMARRVVRGLATMMDRLRPVMTTD